MEILIVGGGIGGMTLALFLHKAGIPCRIAEAAPDIRPLGLGVNLLPHSTRVLNEIGVLDAMAARAIETKESVFFNRFGQLIYREPTGRFAGYGWPQLSIHRGDIQLPLLDAFRARIGADRLHLGHRATRFEQDAEGVTVYFEDTESGAALAPIRADAVIGADGIHSVIRRQLHPNEGDPKYSGVNMWRGSAVWGAFLTGASMTRIGWMTTGKMVLYPIRDDIDGKGNQLINWVFELETPNYKTKRDWNKPGSLGDFWPCVEDWRFDWLDVPALLQASDMVLEFPMVDQDPLPSWTDGRVTLLGDAAHPMYPRGSNGAAQAILDARSLAGHLSARRPPEALRAYEAERLPATAHVVLMNRERPPDIILYEVFKRTGDAPFRKIEDVISGEELRALSDSYKKIAGYDKSALVQ